MTSTPSSSWISTILYRDGFLAMFPLNRDGESTDYALLYGGPTKPVPPWIPGLLNAGTGKRPCSPGLAYNKLVKGKFPYQRVEGEDRVRELKEMMS